MPVKPMICMQVQPKFKHLLNFRMAKESKRCEHNEYLIHSNCLLCCSFAAVLGSHSDPAVETLKNPTIDGRLTMDHKVVVSDCGRSHSHAIQSNSSLLSPSRTASLWLLAPTLCTSCLTHKRKTT